MKKKQKKYLNNILRVNRDHAAEIGKKGGSATSEKKKMACRLNASKPRPNRRKKK